MKIEKNIKNLKIILILLGNKKQMPIILNLITYQNKLFQKVILWF